MAQVVFNHVGGKPPFFDGTCYDYWKRKMRMYLGSINGKWPRMTMLSLIPMIPPTKIRSTSNVIQWLSTPYTMPLIPRCLSKSRVVIELMRCGRDWRKHMRAHRWSRLKSVKLYILKDKLISFKMKDDESIPEMFFRLQVIVNDLMSLGE